MGTKISQGGNNGRVGNGECVIHLHSKLFSTHSFSLPFSHSHSLALSLSLLAHDIGKIFICFHGFNDFSQSTKTQKLPNKIFTSSSQTSSLSTSIYFRAHFTDLAPLCLRDRSVHDAPQQPRSPLLLSLFLLTQLF